MAKDTKTKYPQKASRSLRLKPQTLADLQIIATAAEEKVSATIRRFIEDGVKRELRK